MRTEQPQHSLLTNQSMTKNILEAPTNSITNFPPLLSTTMTTMPNSLQTASASTTTTTPTASDRSNNHLKVH